MFDELDVPLEDRWDGIPEAALESDELASGGLGFDGFETEPEGLPFDGDDEVDPADVPPAAGAVDWAMAAAPPNAPNAASAVKVMRFFMVPPEVDVTNVNVEVTL